MSLFLLLPLAAILEVGGDALIRLGFTGGGSRWLAVGALLLVSYGVVVNGNPRVDFNRLLGVYIAVFFFVSQVVGATLFGERLSPSLALGGSLIVAGGLVIQFGG
jgi:drug/metabolite transporter superfamily protein YnfA